MSNASRRTFAGLSSLAVPTYRWWFLSQILSASGLVTQNVGAAWLMLELTGRGVDLAFLTCATMLPVLFGGAFGGTLIDRFDRRRTLLVTQSAFLVFSTSLFLLTVTGHATLPSLLLISALSGCVNAIDNPARQVYVLQLVGRDRLISAVSLYEVVQNASRMIGPALGGLLLTVSGPAACFLANAISFVPPLLVLIYHRCRVADSASDARGRARQRGGVSAGLRYVWRVPEIRACLLLVTAGNLIITNTVLFPLLASDVFRLSGGGYSALVTAFGVGAVPGALRAAQTREDPSGRMVARLAVATAVGMALTALAPDVVVGLLGIAIAGFGVICFVAVANTLVQVRARPDLRGRVMGAWVMALPGMAPLTALFEGWLSDMAGVRVAMSVAACILCVAALSGYRALSQARARTPAEGLEP